MRVLFWAAQCLGRVLQRRASGNGRHDTSSLDILQAQATAVASSLDDSQVTRMTFQAKALKGEALAQGSGMVYREALYDSCLSCPDVNNKLLGDSICSPSSIPVYS
jgi:hypothetical protein